MKTFTSTHCQESHFATLCSDCLAEEIYILETRSALHIGQCHRCGHIDAEPRSGYASSSEVMMTHATENELHPLKSLGGIVASLATRATSMIKGEIARRIQT